MILFPYLHEDWTIPHNGDLVEWADGKLKLPYSVRYPVFLAGESPWLLEPMRAMSDPKIRRVDFRAPAGAAKSLVGEIHIAHSIVEANGLYYYVWQTDDDAKDAMEDRILPMIEANDFLSRRLPAEKDKVRRQKIVFPGLSFYCIAAKASKANSKRVRTLIMEEPHLYEPGMMKAFEDRTTGVKNYKILTLSTGSILEDESDLAFCEGSCEEWQVPCPHCREFQTMTDARDRLRSDSNAETTDANGEFDWKKFAPTVRYNCEHCGLDWPTDNKFRHDQAKLGRYVAMNPNAAEDHRSFHLEAVSIHYEGFELHTTLIKKLKAVAAYKRGAIEPFKNYIQKTRAMAWDESPGETDEQAAFDRSKGEYMKKDPCEFEIARFIGIDNQAGKASQGEGAHRWYVCRSFGPNECRLIDEGRVTSWEEMEEKRIDLGVEPGRTLVDIAFDTVAVQAVCVRYGWQGLWGDNTGKKSFPHHETVIVNNRPERVVRHYPFSSVNVGHVGLGKGGVRRQARYFFWCQHPIKNMWHRLKNGLTASFRWTVPQDVSDEYRDQTRVEFKKMQTGKDGKKTWGWFTQSKKANHLTDCDQMTLVGALMDARIRGILWSDGSEEDQPTENTES